MKLFVCERCRSIEDIGLVYVNDEPKSYCQKCRTEMFTKKKPVGRPTLGITKKVSLTLSEDDWEWFDKKAEGNRSALLRETVKESKQSEDRWSDKSCLGYVILGAKKLGYDEKLIRELARAVNVEFDIKTLDEAKEVYKKSSY